jgi:hypothetical protein
MSILPTPLDEVDEDATFDLRALTLAGGNPYILIAVEDPEVGGVRVTHHGFGPDLDLAGALQELALLIATIRG